MATKEKKIPVVYPAEIPPKEELKIIQQSRIGQRDIKPNQIVDRLLASITSSQIPTRHKKRLSVFIKDTADAAAGDATAEIPVFQPPDAVTITGAFYLPAAALTSNDTNYATLIVYKRGIDGSAPISIASQTTKTTGSGNWVAFDGVSLGTLSNTGVSAGQIVTFEITKASSGVVVPRGILQIEMTVD